MTDKIELNALIDLLSAMKEYILEAMKNDN